MGVYSVGDTQSFSNAPGSADNGYLYVFASGSEKIRQIYGLDYIALDFIQDIIIMDIGVNGRQLLN